jgi:hypothetical protein
MLIHEKVVLPNTLSALAAIWSEFPGSLQSFFPDYGKKRHSVCSRKNRMKMSANREDAFGQWSNHRARS